MEQSDESGDIRNCILRVAPGVEPMQLDLDPIGGFLLSRIDGSTSWSTLRESAGIGPAEVDRVLEGWLAQGLVEAGGVADPEVAPPPCPPPERDPSDVPSAPVPESTPEPVSLPAELVAEIDPALDLPVALQERLLRLELQLDAPYHEILGVSPDADRSAIKDAYLNLSRAFHPDRYFRGDVGAFGARLDTVYKKIVEAYALLSDPSARSEVERLLADGAGSGTRRMARRGRRSLRPRLHSFSLHGRIARERRAKAKRHFEAGMAAFSCEQWLRAASGVRLAIATDPQNEYYKKCFTEVQGKAHEYLAQFHIKRAEMALDLRDRSAALQSFEEALPYRPQDADLLFRSAQLSFDLERDLRPTLEWAQAAVELAPEVTEHHRLVAQILQTLGFDRRARSHWEAVLRAEPGDGEAKTALRGSGGRFRTSRWFGGKQ